MDDRWSQEGEYLQMVTLLPSLELYLTCNAICCMLNWGCCNRKH